ncbi:hypothetical protein [Amycolatopsis sp. cmx-4-61]|uniref:hypothetical protein n=1 Tax=Amycolatopsis sp. cmx-4-61 TaxID=2790937 RepID=UPI00397CCD2C
MQRGSDQHSPREDDAQEAELRGALQGNGPAHAEDRRDPELAAEDEPEVPPLGGGA